MSLKIQKSQKKRTGVLFWENKFDTRDFGSASDLLNDFAVRKGNWKLVFEDLDVKTVPYLFNLADDPGEAKDLALAYPEIVDELSDLYWAWRQRVGKIDYTFNLNNQSRLTLSENSRFDFSRGDFSVQARIKLDEGCCDQGGIIVKRAGVFHFKVDLHNRLKLVVYPHDDDQGTERILLVSEAILEPGRWYNVAFTVHEFRSEADIIRLYIDKNLEVESRGLYIVQSNDNPMYIGNNDWLSAPFLGEIENLTFHMQSLSVNELR